MDDDGPQHLRHGPRPSDASSPLYLAHASLTQIVTKVDNLMLEAHKPGSRQRIPARDLARFCNLLATMASSLEEWIPVFEGAAAAERSSNEESEREEEERRPYLPSLGAWPEEDKKHALGDDSQSASSPSVFREFFLLAMADEALGTADEASAIARETNLSDSPLVPWLDKAQFFMLTPISHRPRAFTPRTASPFPHLAEEQSLHDLPSTTTSPLQESLQDQPHAISPLRVVLSPIHESPFSTASLPALTEPAASPPLTPVNVAEPSSPGKLHCSESSSGIDLATPLPPQSLMKRYSCFFNSSEPQLKTSSPMTLTPVTMSSPPKTCILMKPDNAAPLLQESDFETPMLLLKSPFRTPGIFLWPPGPAEEAFPEDMQLTALKKPGLPPRPPESIKRTPSSDMQFATIRRPSLPCPGEQTLKRELWCKMEAEFASMAEVCKSLFPDPQTEAPRSGSDTQAGRDAQKPQGKDRFKLPSVPRRFQLTAPKPQ